MEKDCFKWFKMAGTTKVLSFKVYFVRALVVFFVYIFTQDHISEAKGLNGKYMVSKNILRQLKGNDLKYKDNIDVLSLSKRTLMAKQVNARIRKHILTSQTNEVKNGEKYIAKRQVSVLIFKTILHFTFSNNSPCNCFKIVV